MMDGERRDFVRARQRSRSALKSFSVPLVPTTSEVGVDRMQVGVRGTWDLNGDTATGRAITPQNFSAAFTRLYEQSGWFRKPQSNRKGMTLLTKANAPNTLGSIRLFVSDIAAGQGTFDVSITCNPTRTLGHLLVSSRDEGDFLEWLNNQSHFGFFARSVVSPSLDNGDNWLPDLDLAHSLCGPDIFETFFPVFASKLMELAAHLVVPVGALEIVDEGTDRLALADNLTARFGWGRATVPQIETYIERHHSEARSVIRATAQAMLASLDETRVRHHLSRISFERQEDLFSIRSKLPADRDLSIYAKSPDRLRFEVSRPKRGRYDPQLLFRPEERLLQIFRTERNELPECCDWDAVACLFEEPSAPILGDPVALVSNVADVCASCDAAATPVLEALLVDSGLRADLEDVPHAVISQLLARGVIRRVSLRKRNRPGERRYSLTSNYLSVMECVKTALAANISPTHSPYRKPT